MAHERQESIYGPPGTGKTTAVIERLRTLLAGGCRPRDVAFTSFTRTAADVAKARAIESVGGEDDDFRYFGTLHSLCGKLIDFDWHNRLLSENRGKGRALLTSFGRREGFRFDFTGDVDMEADVFTGQAPIGNELLAWWNWARQSDLDIETALTRWRQVALTTSPPDLYRRFVERYEEYKQDLKLADFTDVLTLADDRQVRPLVQALIVDEAQDLSPLQWRIIDRWRATIPAIYLAGDDDQAIYAFQAADARLFLERSRDGGITTLDQSHRLPRKPWALATHLSDQITVRQEKPFAPQDRSGVVMERAIFGIAWDIPGSWFVLARNTYLLKAARQALEEKAIPYTSRRGYDPLKHLFPAARAITALARGKAISRDDLPALVQKLQIGRDYRPYLEQRITPSALRSVPMVLTRDDLDDLGFTEPFLERLEQDQLPTRMLHHVSKRGYVQAQTWNYLVKLQERHGDAVFDRVPTITLSTIHGVKGDEADHVVLMTDMAKASVRTLDTDPDNEHRVWYVGASRARESVTVLCPTTPISYWPLSNGGWRTAARTA